MRLFKKFPIVLYFLKKQVSALSVLGGILGITLLASFFIPFFIRDFTDAVIYQNNGLDELYKIGAILLILWLGRFIFTTIYQFLFIRINYRLLNDIRLRLYLKIINTPYSKIRKYKSGDLMSRAFQESQALQETICNGYINTFKDILNFIAYFALLVYFLKYFALLVILILPTFIAFYYLFRNRISLISRDVYNLGGVVHNACDRVVKSIKFIAASRIRATISEYLNKMFEKLTARSIKLYTYGRMAEQCYSFSELIIYIVVFFGGCYYVYKGETTFGVLMAVTSFINNLVTSSRSIVSLFTNIKSSQGYLERLNEIWELPDRQVSGINYKSPAKLEHIEVSGLHYSYDDNTIIEECPEIILERNKRYALVGETGSGKSTLIDLLVGVLPAVQGKILINGLDIRNVEDNWFYMNTGVLLQEDYLFDMSIKENIEIVGKEVGCNLNNILAKYKLNEFFERFPEGLNTHVYNNGENLSGGEKRLIGVLRLFARNPELIITDEPETGLDIKLRKKLDEMLDDLSKNRILINISHHRGDMEKFSKVIYISDSIVYFDSHRNLFEENDKYREFILHYSNS